MTKYNPMQDPCYKQTEHNQMMNKKWSGNFNKRYGIKVKRSWRQTITREKSTNHIYKKKSCCVFRHAPLIFHDKLGQNLLLCEQCQLLHMSSICTLRAKGTQINKRTSARCCTIHLDKRTRTLQLFHQPGHVYPDICNLEKYQLPA